MKKIFSAFILFGLSIGYSVCENTSILYGNISLIPNPCTTSPCLPGMVYAIANDTSNFIIKVNKSWQTPENPLTINNTTYNVDDSVKAIGLISSKKDLNNNKYYEIEIDTIYNVVTSVDLVQQRDILIYHDNTNNSLFIKSDNINIHQVEVFNSSGRIVSISRNNSAKRIIIINDIKYKGIAIVRITTCNHKVIINKIIIQ